MKNTKNLRISQVLFHPKSWDWRLKAVAILSVLTFLALLCCFFFLQLEVSSCIWYFSNVVVLEAVVAWYLLDIFVSRRAIYSWCKGREPAIVIEIRFTRRIIALIVTLLLVATIGTDTRFNHGQAETQELSRLYGESRNLALVLAGIFIATFGWMYTDFRKQVSDRITNTLSGAHQQIYGQTFVVLTQQLIALVKHARDSELDGGNGILKVAAFDLRLASAFEGFEIEGVENVTLGNLVNRLLNALDQIAYGVRAGYYDFHTVEMVFRQRYIVRTYEFMEYIKKGTDAVYDDDSEQFRAKNRTWEHCLWMVDQLPILDSDNIAPENRKYIVLPPKVSGR